MGKFDQLYNAFLEQEQPSITVSKPAAPSAEELRLLKRLHNSAYNPRSVVDQKNLGYLRTAGRLAGGYQNFQKIIPTVYALQYANTKQGNAYKRKAERMGINFSEPEQQAVPDQVQIVPSNNNQDLAPSVGQPTGITPDEWQKRRAAQTGIPAPASNLNAIAQQLNVDPKALEQFVQQNKLS